MSRSNRRSRTDAGNLTREEPPGQRRRNHLTPCCTCSRHSTCAQVPRGELVCACRQAGRNCVSCAFLQQYRNTAAAPAFTSEGASSTTERSQTTVRAFFSLVRTVPLASTATGDNNNSEQNNTGQTDGNPTQTTGAAGNLEAETTHVDGDRDADAPAGGFGRNDNEPVPETGELRGGSHDPNCYGYGYGHGGWC